jgi:hypothetical protein
MALGKVFISYRRQDSAAYAGRVRDRLEREFGRDLLFLDVDTIPLGTNFSEVLHEEVAECGVLLAIIGPNWLNAHGEGRSCRLDDPKDFVRSEIAAALQRKIRVIPVLHDGASIPKVEQLPEDIKELAFRNGLEIRHPSFQDDMSRLIRELKDQVRPSKPAKVTVFGSGAGPWREIDHRGIGRRQFLRDFEIDADPVFDLVVENTSGGPLLLLRTGIRIIQRRPGTGGVMGSPQATKVQAEYSLYCREEWKRRDLKHNESWAVFQDPVWMKKSTSPFRFTLRLENFCDTDNASSSEICFRIQTSTGMVESESIWLVQSSDPPEIARA